MLESGLRDILVVDGEESVYHAEQAQAGLDTIVALSFPLVEEKSGNVDSRVIAQRRCAIGEGRPGSRRGQRDSVHEGGRQMCQTLLLCEEGRRVFHTHARALCAARAKRPERPRKKLTGSIPAGLACDFNRVEVGSGLGHRVTRAPG
jgi:hypothetical protein